MFSILYEICWSRLLKLVFINETYAIAATLAIYVLSLAIGAALSANYLNNIYSRKHNLLKLFSLQQFFIVLFVIASKYLLDADVYQPLILKIINQLSLYFSLTNYLTVINLILKFIYCLIIIFPAGILLGTSFPVLSEILNLTRIDASRKTQMSLAYILNITGSVLGAIVAGLYLLVNFGLSQTIFIGALANLLLALLTWSQASKLKTKTKFKLKNLLKVRNIKYPARNIFKIVYLYSFVLGFILFAFEVLWIRILAEFISSSHYSITIVIVSVLIGIGLGSISFTFINESLSSKFYLSKNIIRTFKVLTVILVAFTFLNIFEVNLLAKLLAGLNRDLILLGDQGLRASVLSLLNFLVKFLIASLLTIPISFVFGYLFTYFLNIIYQEKNNIYSSYGAKIAKLYTYNTIGSILGSLIMGFILLPLLKDPYINATKILAGIIILLGLALCFHEKVNFARSDKAKVENLYYTYFYVFLAVIVVIFKLQFNYASIINAANPNPYKLKLLEHRFGKYSSISIAEVENSRFLLSNSKVEAGVPLDRHKYSATDIITEQSLAILPYLALKETEKEALVIGYGSGMTARTLASYPLIRKVTVNEIEKEVYKLSDTYFGNKLAASLDKIERKVINAREYLEKPDTPKYDLIISQPSDPWISNQLFTKSFYELTASKLKNDGIFTCWLQLYSLDDKHLKIMLNTIQNSFKHFIIFKMPRTAELIILASFTPIEFDYENINYKLLTNPTLNEDLELIGLNNFAEVYANLVADERSVAKALSETKLYNTDDNMLLELHTSKNERNSLKYFKEDLDFFLDNLKLNTFHKHIKFVDLFDKSMFYHRLQNLFEARDYKKILSQLEKFIKGKELTAYLLDSPKTAETKLLEEASIYYIQKRFDKAQLVYKNLIYQNPYLAKAYYGLAKIQFREKEYEKAYDNLIYALAINPNSKIINYLMMMTARQLGLHEISRKHYHSYNTSKLKLEDKVEIKQLRKLKILKENS